MITQLASAEAWMLSLAAWLQSECSPRSCTLCFIDGGVFDVLPPVRINQAACCVFLISCQDVAAAAGLLLPLSAQSPTPTLLESSNNQAVKAER